MIQSKDEEGVRHKMKLDEENNRMEELEKSKNE